MGGVGGVDVAVYLSSVLKVILIFFFFYLADRRRRAPPAARGPFQVLTGRGQLPVRHHHGWPLGETTRFICSYVLTLACAAADPIGVTLIKK